ncbi:MAG: ribosome silencing factor [Chloroflexi bacterium]|nr:ribosome silencing factor [Chloroflexota bacterium]
MAPREQTEPGEPSGPSVSEHDQARLSRRKTGDAESILSRIVEKRPISEREPVSPASQANGIDLARRIVEIESDRQAENIVLLDIRPVANFANYFVIATGTSDRHIKAIADAVVESLREHGEQPFQIEGTPDSGWVLIDYGDVIVHVFAPEQRQFYQLERLWSEAPTLLHIH